MEDVYKIIDEYNIDKERKILIVFDDMIADMINNKNLNSIVTEFFIRCTKLNIFLVFITQSYFKIPKDVRLNTTHFFIMKIPNKESFNKLHQILHKILALKISLRCTEECTAKLYSFLVNDTTLASDNSVRLTKNLFNI